MILDGFLEGLDDCVNYVLVSNYSYQLSIIIKNGELDVEDLD
jgi:hypothetical protein